MEETLIRLENAFEHAFDLYLQAKDCENEAAAYRRFMEAYTALKTFEDAGEENADLTV